MVDVSHARTGPWVLLKVRDHGRASRPKKLAQLIKPFFRGDAARTAATGAGLGLAIVDKTVQRMGGIFALANATDGRAGGAHQAASEPRSQPRRRGREAPKAAASA